MKTILGSALGASVLLAGAAFAAAPKLAAGLYTSEGIVQSATSQCSAVGLSQGAGNFSIVKYPGEGKTGLTIYTPVGGILQLCTGFAAVPAGGLGSFTSNAKCTTYEESTTIPAETVNFAFTSTVEDANSAVGTTTVTIPVTAGLGGGCTAKINTTIVRSGK